MNKYLKTSLISTGLYITLLALILLLNARFNSGVGLGASIIKTIPECFLSSDPWISPVCFQGMKAADAAIFAIPYYGMILAALIAAITGLIAVYYAVSTRTKWWHAITVYGAVNALLVFGVILGIFTT